VGLNSKLPEFMYEIAAKEFRWGEFDCSLWLADWYVFATLNPDPAYYLRRSYRTEYQCREKYGTAAAARMIREVARLAKLERTKDPFLGDVGAIEIIDENKKQIICGAIRARNSWTVLTPKGIQRIPDDQSRTIMAFKIEEKDTDAASHSLGNCGGRSRSSSFRSGGRSDNSRHNRHIASGKHRNLVCAVGNSRFDNGCKSAAPSTTETKH
jgi:hypothetical protein